MHKYRDKNRDITLYILGNVPRIKSPQLSWDEQRVGKRL
nr:MAG TPA: hypothetical protein [Caudoviricetes sp.]